MEDTSTVLNQEACAATAVEQLPRKSLLARIAVFLGTYLFVLLLFALLISPVVIGYVWFFHDLERSLQFFDWTVHHPPHYYRILKGAAVGCMLYSGYVSWKILKFIRPRFMLFCILFVGSFFTAVFLCDMLYTRNYF